MNNSRSFSLTFFYFLPIPSALFFSSFSPDSLSYFFFIFSHSFSLILTFVPLIMKFHYFHFPSVASGSKDTTVQIWDANTADHIATCTMPDNKVVTSLAPAAPGSGATFFCGNLNGSFQAWNLEGGVATCAQQTRAGVGGYD